MSSRHVFRTFAVVVFVSGSLLAQAPEPKQVLVYGQKIEYLEAGTGPTVILLHGLGGNKENWRFTIPALAARFHVVAPDQLGFGASDKPMIDYRPATLTDFLDEFMRKLSIPKATIVGNSLGGWVAADFAIRYPAEAERIVLLDAAGYFVRDVKRDDVTFLHPATLEEARIAVRKIFTKKELTSEAFARGFFAARLRAGDGYTIDRFVDSMVRGEDRLNDRLVSIHIPTLVLWGRDDALLPVSIAETMAKQIPGARLVALDGCGHAPQFECADAFNQALLTFLTAP
jgi:pimeloyl-ACP methyl ester carboxylesterase